MNLEIILQIKRKLLIIDRLKITDVKLLNTFKTLKFLLKKAIIYYQESKEFSKADLDLIKKYVN